MSSSHACRPFLATPPPCDSRPAACHALLNCPAAEPACHALLTLRAVLRSVSRPTVSCVVAQLGRSTYYTHITAPSRHERDPLWRHTDARCRTEQLAQTNTRHAVGAVGSRGVRTWVCCCNNAPDSTHVQSTGPLIPAPGSATTLSRVHINRVSARPDTNQAVSQAPRPLAQAKQALYAWATATQKGSASMLCPASLTLWTRR